VGEEAPEKPWLRAVKEAVERFSERFGRPEAVVVFGSWSRSGGGDWSNVDVLVVVDSVEWVNVLDRFAALADLRALGVDVFVYSFREVESMARLAAELSKAYRKVGRMWIRRNAPPDAGQVT